MCLKKHNQALQFFQMTRSTLFKNILANSLHVDSDVIRTMRTKKDTEVKTHQTDQNGDDVGLTMSKGGLD